MAAARVHALAATVVALIAMAPLEIARLDNDPSRPENGKIQFILKGGL